MRLRAALLATALVAARSAWSQGTPANSETISPWTARAAQEFSQGDNKAACADAREALRRNSADERALGIARMTCGDKSFYKLDYKKKPGKQEPPEQNIVPKQTAAAPAPRPAPAPQPSAPAAPEENLPSQVISAGPAAPGIREQPTTYERLLQAQSLLSQGKPQDAAAAAQQAIALQPRNRQAYDALASALRQMRNYQQVLAVADAGLKTFPNDVDLLKNKIFALNKDKNFKAALETAELALAANATDPILHVLKAYALGRSGDREGMLKSLETAAALDPSFEPLLLEARRYSADGEPFLMPGDSRPTAQARPLARPASRPWTGLLLFGGLILLLLIMAALLVTGLFSKETAP